MFLSDFCTIYELSIQKSECTLLTILKPHMCETMFCCQLRGVWGQRTIVQQPGGRPEFFLFPVSY